MKRLLVAFMLCVVGAFAADITGTWKATGDGQNGPMERTFTFKQDGAKLTGVTESSFAGKSEIKDGKVDGDTVTFSIALKFGDQDMTMKYTGKVAGNEIKFKAEGSDGGGMTMEWVAKKQ
jgi:hypothetical protein